MLIWVGGRAWWGGTIQSISFPKMWRVMFGHYGIVATIPSRIDMASKNEMWKKVERAADGEVTKPWIGVDLGF